MSDILKDLVTDQSCEGSTSGTSNNPLNTVFQNFIETSRTQKLINEVKLDKSVNLSNLEKEKIKARSGVMAKQFFPDKEEKFVNDQISAFLNSLKIENDASLSSRYLQRSQLLSSSTGVESLDGEFQEGVSGFNGGDELLDDYGQEDMLQDAMRNFALRDPEYIFSNEPNPYLNKGNALQIGLELFSHGDITQAILAFEAELQTNPQNSNCWRLLGRAHAECDNDNQAICAYIQGYKLGDGNQDVLLDLACSYTNELNKFKALTYLQTWLKGHQVYDHLFQGIQNQEAQQNYMKLQEQTIQLFMSAHQQNPQDVNVLVAIGVLFNVTDEIDKAIMAFQKAIELNPNDHSLWNKLGATQANGSRSEDAIESYRQALKIKPNYVRAWVNLGIAYSNLKESDQAAKYYVRALRMCPQMDHVWQYLGVAFYSMKRSDLVELCKYKDISLLEKEGF